MSKIFDISFSKGSLIDNVSKTLCTNHTVKFKQTDGGLMGYFDGNSYLEIPSLSLGTEHSLVITKKPIANGALVGGTLTPQSYFLYETITPTEGFYYSVQNVNPGQQLSTALKGTVIQIIVIRNGTSVKMYKNNVLFYDKTLASNPTLTVDRIGSLSDNSNKYTGYIGDVKMFTHALTDKERNKYYTDFLNSKPLVKTKSNFTYPKPVSLNKNGLLASYNMNVVNGNQILDTSGNGYHLTCYNGPTSRKDGIQFNGTNSYARKSSGFSVTDWIIMFRFIPNTVSGGILKYPVGIQSGIGIFIGQTGLDYWGFYDGTSVHTVAPKLTEKAPYTLTVSKQGTTYSFYENGIYITQKTGVSKSITDLCVGSRDTGYGFVDCIVKDLRIYNRALSTQEIINYHNEQAKKVTLKEDFALEPADGTNITPKGWIKGTGSFKVSELTADDSVLKHLRKGTKMLECTTAGTIAVPSTQAYGTWEFDLYKGNTANIIGIYFCRNKTSTDYNSYTFVLYNDEGIYTQKYINGAWNSNLFYTPINYIQNQIYYNIRITRTPSGIFTFYIKGGSFGNIYQLINPSGGYGTNPTTNNDYTTSKFLTLDIDAGDKIGNIKFTEGITV